LLKEIQHDPRITWNRFESGLREWLEDQKANVARRKDAERIIARLTDQVEALAAVQSGVALRGGQGIDALHEWIDGNILDEDKKEDLERQFVTLSTIHKVKGLERKRVFILRPDLVPHPLAETPPALEQEFNLRYVAITRSQSELYFVGEWDGWRERRR
jgi:superfamily I DNA/RNA helicase